MDHYCTVRDSSFKTHCTQLCRSGASGPCCHREVCRPSAVIPSVRNIPQSGRGADTVAELLEPLYDVLRQYVLMPGKVHADDIPVPVGSRAVVKTERTGCGSTSVMTVMPGRRCPGGLVRVQSGPERYPSTESSGRLQRCASGRYLRWLPGVIRIRQNNGSRVYGPCPEENPRFACKSAN